MCADAMKRFGTIAVAVVVVALMIVVVGILRTSSQQRAAAMIRIGDSKAEVERLLGKPTMITPFTPLWRTNALAALFCDTAETWAYGREFILQKRFPWLQFRFFQPDVSDVSVEFSSSNRVVRVTIPLTGS